MGKVEKAYVKVDQAVEKVKTDAEKFVVKTVKKVGKVLNDDIVKPVAQDIKKAEDVFDKTAVGKWTNDKIHKAEDWVADEWDEGSAWVKQKVLGQTASIGKDGYCSGVGVLNVEVWQKQALQHKAGGKGGGGLRVQGSGFSLKLEETDECEHCFGKVPKVMGPDYNHWTPDWTVRRLGMLNRLCFRVCFVGPRRVRYVYLRFVNSACRGGKAIMK